MKKFTNKIITVPLAENIIQKIKILLTWSYVRLFKRDKYVSERYREVSPKTVDEIFIDKTSDVAILMRGQIIKVDDFTMNSLKMYRLYYPDAEIFLSTWDYCVDEQFYDFANKYNIKLVLSKFVKPKTGYKSDNLQIIGNVNGLKEIIKNKIQYTLSTRTDQRFYSPNLLLYLKNIISDNPYKKSNNSKDRQKNRLLAMSFDSFMFRLYGIGDMFLFGLTDDVYNYWNSDHDQRIINYKSTNKISLRELAKKRYSEVYFMTEFLKRNGHNLEWTLNDYFEVIRKRFIIIDSSSMDFFWPKYSFFEERHKDFEDIRFKEISFADWLLIKNKQLKVNEKILNLSWN